MTVHPLKINIRQLNILTATIVLANGFSRLVNIPSRGFRVVFWNIQWSIEISGRLPFMMLLALIVVVGSEAFLRSHPLLAEQKPSAQKYSTVIHWILPGIAAFGGSIAVNLFPAGPRWWLGLALISSLLVICVIGEYYVIDRKDIRHDFAAIGLNILGLTLLAIILSATHASSSRLAFALPIITIATSIISLRLLDLLSPHSIRIPLYALGIGVMVSELALPLSFLPITPVVFGLILTLATHTLIGIAQTALEGGIRRAILMEFILLDAIAIILLVLLMGR